MPMLWLQEPGIYKKMRSLELDQASVKSELHHSLAFARAKKFVNTLNEFPKRQSHFFLPGQLALIQEILASPELSGHLIP